MLNDIMREITPLTPSDCFTIFSRVKKEFDFPLHNHEEMELNLILNAKGAKRIVGDHIGEIEDVELALIGSNLPHGWFTHHCKNDHICEVTIQFQRDLFSESFLQKNQSIYIKRMFEQAQRGILFCRDTIQQIAPRILALDKQCGFDSILNLFSLLNDISLAKNTRMLSDTTFTKEIYTYDSRRLEKVFDYMNANFQNQILLSEVSKIANMPEASFSRFIKIHTGFTFTENLIEIRLGHVSRMLISTTHSVSEIAYKCGFNNMANFNRIFKAKKGCTPKEFKKSYKKQHVFI
jgi:AraC-like DNA-binding protein